MSHSHLALPALGTELPALGGTLGAFVANADGSTRAIIVAPHLHSITGAWGKYGKRIPGARGSSGMASTVAMADAGCEIALAMRALKIGEHDDWFIGSQLEMLALDEHSAGLFDKKAIYWTSTQYSAGTAWCQDFENGDSYPSVKVYEFRAVPLRSIHLQDLRASALQDASRIPAASPALA
ncbi:hypothetical protein [Alicycliphilus denitrificans]|uniref:hypothetical protein n=1 Tax=Alicycliphilus denitrificans TaxID=179636 RepID=UPI0001DA0DEF|nr:hypothetical protein [Alicycliphilus denitrificans]ADV01291.1 hypothetical protein Alide_3574 [Alicycliphilus denitrificans BC]